MAALMLASMAAVSSCHAGDLRVCDRQLELTPNQQDKLFRFGSVIKAELAQSGQRVALMARSGTDLSRFGIRYSHAGVSLLASPDTPWAVRQLYYACDERRPRIFDQGIAGFLLGTDEPALGYVSVLLLPPDQAAALERAALDNAQALQLLSPHYSANAYPFSQRYQNCNQWVMELLAAAWSGQAAVPDDPDAAWPPRAQAQRWLQEQGYMPSEIHVGAPLMWLGLFLPWVHNDDQALDDLHRQVYRVSMPASIEAFVRAQAPQATRLEFCHTERQVVVRRGWQPIAEGCQAGPQDAVIPLD
jgi:hypothetical protein